MRERNASEYPPFGAIGEVRKISRYSSDDIVLRPTANIETLDHHKLIPGDGVYAVTVKVGHNQYGGMLNVGTRPTVNYNADHRSIEVHIFDFADDIYHREITIAFIDIIRDEQRFPDIETLRQQLVKDKIKSLELLAKR